MQVNLLDHRKPQMCDDFNLLLLIQPTKPLSNAGIILVILLEVQQVAGIEVEDDVNDRHLLPADVLPFLLRYYLLYVFQCSLDFHPLLL